MTNAANKTTETENNDTKLNLKNLQLHAASRLHFTLNEISAWLPDNILEPKIHVVA